MVGEQQQEQPTEAQQQGEAGGLGAVARQARRGKSGVYLVAPQSVVLVYLKEKHIQLAKLFFLFYFLGVEK